MLIPNPAAANGNGPPRRRSLREFLAETTRNRTHPPCVCRSVHSLIAESELAVVRNLFDRLSLADWIESRSKEEKVVFRPRLVTENRLASLLCGGDVTDDVPLPDQRGVCRAVGWPRVLAPTTFGRWLRRTSEKMVPLTDRLLWTMVRRHRTPGAVFPGD